MKRLTLTMFTAVSVLSACSNGSKTTVTPTEPVHKFTDYFSQWSGLVLEGKDTMVDGYANRLTSIGLYQSDSLFGQFIYKADTYRIQVTNTIRTEVSKTAANNYAYDGWYNDVRISKHNGGSWDGRLGLYNYPVKGFYRLDILTNTTTFLSKSYTDSL